MARAKAKPPVPTLSPPVVKVHERLFVVKADYLGRFARDWVSGKEADVTSVRDLNPNDPREYGYVGTLPQSKARIPPEKLFRLYKEEGTFARIMDQISEDSWAEGWTLSTKNEAWIQEAEALDQLLDVRGRMELADKWHLVGGLSLLYLNLEAVGRPWQDPNNVRSVFNLKAIPRTRIKEALIQTDPEDDEGRFDQPRAWVLHNADGGQLTCHWRRVFEFKQFPNPDSDWDGLALGARCFDDIAYKRNVEWAAATAYGQRNAPLLVIKIKEGVKVSQPELDKIEDEFELLNNHTIQNVIARNFDVVPLTGSAQLPDPMNFWLIAIRSLSVTTRIPSHILAGMAVGELASSSEDTRRYHGYVSRRQENFCVKPLREWYGRLAEWGLLHPVPSDLKIAWKPLGEPTAKEEMEIEDLRGRTLQTYRNSGVQPPAKLVDYVPGEPFLSTQAPPIRSFPGFGGGGIQERGVKENLTDQEKVRVAGVRRVERMMEDKLANALDEFWEKWLPTLLGFLAKVGQEASAPKAPASVTTQLERSLRQAVMDAYAEAARMGAEDVFHKAGKEEVREVLDRDGVAYFRTVSKLRGAETAKRITARIRNEVADGLAHDENVGLIRDRVQRTYRDLARWEAERIARTEAMTAYNAGTTAGMKAIDVKEFRFVAFPGADDGDPDGACVQHDGHIFEVGSEDATPPLHPNCRCYMEAIIPGLTS